MKVIKVLMVAAFGLVSVGGIQAQAAKASRMAAKAEPAKSVEDLVGGFEGEMMRAAKAMPAEKYGFTPASLHIPGATFAGVRTFAEEVKHVAQSNYLTAAGIRGMQPGVDVKAIGALTSKDAIVAALAESFVAVHQAIATITPANENEAVEDAGVGSHQTKESEAAWVAVHGSDHYGQMVEYLRMNGIVLPSVPFPPA